MNPPPLANFLELNFDTTKKEDFTIITALYWDHLGQLKLIWTYICSSIESYAGEVKAVLMVT
jgi:hypothetical protein